MPPAVSLDDHATDVVALAAETPGTKVVLVGHSYGGCVVLRAAELAPSLVRAVVVFESPLPWLDGWPTTSGGGMSLGAPTPQLAGEGFMRRMIGDERWEALPEKAKTDRRAEGAALQNDMRSIRPTVGQRLPLDLAGWRRLAIPLVVARGELSSAHLRWGAAALAQMAGAELHDIAGASHGAHVSHPAAMAALVVRAMEIGGD